MSLSKRFFSPAKLNLFFQILSKRKDLYHEIASIYQAIDLGDFLHFQIAEKNLLTCSKKDIPLDETNLVMKALLLWQKAFPKSPKFHVHIEKNIPKEAGLGGASSNAATTLWALNEFSGFVLNTKELCSLGKKIGSDVNFFFSQGLAFCTGRGEIIQELSELHIFSGYLAKPSFSLKTPLVFQNVFKKDYAKVPFTLEKFFQKPSYFNDLEKAAFRVEPRLFSYKTYLESCGFSALSMTGSGTSYFCLGEPLPEKKSSFIPISSIQRKPNSWFSCV